MAEQRLPIVDSDDGVWGDILRQYLMKEHTNTDTDVATNGGHQKITITAGTASAGTAPIKFTTGTLMTNPEAGAMEFAGDNYYLTQTTSAIRKKVAIYDDNSGATGDIYYRNSSGYFARLPVGNSSEVLTVSGGEPEWAAPPTGGTVWNTVTSTSQSASAGNGYFTNNASLVTVTLPSTCALGDIVEVVGLGAGGWKIAQTSGHAIRFGTMITTTGTGGYLASVNQYDAVRLICITANSTWSVISSQGNITVV